MSTHGSFTYAPRPGSGSGLESSIGQPRESFDSPGQHKKLTDSSTTSTRAHGGFRWIGDRAASSHALLARCNLTDPCEFTSSRISRPKCAPTAEVFGNLPSYLEYVNSSPREEELDGENDENDNGRILSPLKKRQRRKLRESAGVNAKSSRRHRTSVVGPSDLKARTSLPPVGRMQCLWGSNCTTRMDFDYTFKTIKDWKNHIASHLVKPSKPTEDSVGRGQMVKILKCSWGGCSANVEKGYLFKHIVTHEVRFKLLCPRGCGVAIRDDNLERHLKSCRLDG